MTNFSDGSVFIIIYVEKLFISLFQKEAKKSQEKRTKPNEIFSDKTDWEGAKIEKFGSFHAKLATLIPILNTQTLHYSKIYRLFGYLWAWYFSSFFVSGVSITIFIHAQS